MTEIRVRLRPPCHPLPTEEADSDHDQPTRRTSESPHQPAEGDEYTVFVELPVDRVQNTLVFRSVEIGLVSDDLHNVLTRHGRGIELNDVQAGLRCLGGRGGGFLWHTKVPDAWETGGEGSAEHFFDFAVKRA